MEKYKQLKRKHHYIWRHYLKRWATGKDIFYISKKGKIAHDSVIGLEGLARELDFYKINLLDDTDIEFIKEFSLLSPSYIQKIHMSYLRNFIKLSNISNSISEIYDAPENLVLTKRIIQHNSLENLHSSIEDEASKVISILAKGDSEILESNENMIAFCYYIGHQISRTNAMKDSMEVAALKAVSSVGENNPELRGLFEKNWWFLSFMIGVNIGCDLYETRNRDHHVYIYNDTDEPFITSDRPITNMHSSLESVSEGQPPNNSDFYIPLSPRYAYMINNSPDFNHLGDSISLKEVIAFNENVARKRYSTLFGNSREVLNKYKNHVK